MTTYFTRHLGGLMVVFAAQVHCFGEQECHMLSGTVFDFPLICEEPVVWTPETETSAEFRRTGTELWLPCWIDAIEGDDREPLTTAVELCAKSPPTQKSVTCTFTFQQGLTRAPGPYDYDVRVRIGEFSGETVLRTGHDGGPCFGANFSEVLRITK